MKIVVVGGVAAGPKAAARVRRLLPEAEITLVEQDEALSYAGCGLPYHLGGMVPSLQALMETNEGVLRTADYFWATKRIRALTRTRAEEIDRAGRRVRVRSLESGEERWLPYDKLVLATGAAPLRPRLSGLDLRGVFFLHTPSDAAAMQEYLAAEKVERAVIVGAGLIGLEMADALVNRRVRVTVLEMADQILPGPLDWEMARLAESQLEHPFLRIVTGAPMQGAEGEGRVQAVATPQGKLPADLVLVAVGVRPNVGLAQAAGLALGPTGAIATDDRMRTSDPAIYAGGDCVETTHLVSGQKVFLPLGSTANKQGRVIGSNLGGLDDRFPGVVGTMALQTFDVNIGRTGLTERQALQAGYDVVTAVAPNFDNAHFYPLHDRITLKLVVEAGTGRLLGAQGVGAGDVVRRIDVLATAISLGATVEQAAQLDLAYAPPFAEAMDAALKVCNVARNKQGGLAQTTRLEELRERLAAGEEVLLLDVRSPEEVASSPVEVKGAEVLAIPLAALRDRLAEVPRDKALVVMCALGIRGYEAQRVLSGAGFQRVTFLEGGLAPIFAGMV
ncbi:MAG: FAD-dependent oxidoreductase [Chloroflexi bacterium]|nr:FAD-dependent oxidoreductase [Chloroflexota bacterium]